MRRLFKYLTVLVVLASLAGIVYGFVIMEDDSVTANKCIGFGTVGLFLVAMPMFLIIESRGKKMKDYMLTQENLRKMQGKDPKKTENQ
jgi:hypothetical protein